MGWLYRLPLGLTEWEKICTSSLQDQVALKYSNAKCKPKENESQEACSWGSIDFGSYKEYCYCDRLDYDHVGN